MSSLRGAFARKVLKVDSRLPRHVGEVNGWVTGRKAAAELAGDALDCLARRIGLRTMTQGEQEARSQQDQPGSNERMFDDQTFAPRKQGRGSPQLTPITQV